MYNEIARNKRRSVVFIIVFFLIWMGVGAVCGLLFAAFYHPVNPNTGAVTRTGASPIFVGIAIFAVLAFFGFLYSIRSGASLVLRVSGAKPANPTQYRQLYDLVSALAIGEGIPAPAIYVIDDPSPNAFATGVSPDKASITFTTGLLQIMNREELEGVIGHEMSHIKNHDIRLLLVVGTMIGMAALLASVLWRSAFFAGMGRGGRNSGVLLLVVFSAGALLAIVGFSGGSADPLGPFTTPGIAGRCQRGGTDPQPRRPPQCFAKAAAKRQAVRLISITPRPPCASTTRCSITRPGTTTSTTPTLPSRSGSLSSRRSPRVSRSD